MEEYFRLRLNEEDQKGCTEKLQTWNKPKPSKVDAGPTNLVSLTKKIFGIEKRPKVYAVNNWDCRETSRRKIQPDRRANLRKQLLSIDQARREAAIHPVVSATNDVQRKTAIESQTMIMRYSTSCFLQLLDDEPPQSSESRTLLTRDKRLARAKVQKLQFQSNLSKLLEQVNCDHSYSTSSISASHHKVENKPPSLNVVRNLYEEHICISPSKAVEIETLTRKQSCSDLWHQERAFRISASIMKTVCHRKNNTNINTFITSRLCTKAINSVAINYGRMHEDIAIRSYVEYQEKKGLHLSVYKCGLHINPAIPWLAATPDAIVEIGEIKGCLEVKCPYVCKTKQIAQAALANLFCLQINNETLHLNKKHQYFYQVQTQLYVNGATLLYWP